MPIFGSHARIIIHLQPICQCFSFQSRIQTKKNKLLMILPSRYPCICLVEIFYIELNLLEVICKDEMKEYEIIDVQIVLRPINAV